MHLFPGCNRLRCLFGVENLVCPFSNDFLRCPAVDTFGAFVPVDNAVIQIPHRDCIMRLIKQLSLISYPRLSLLALGDVSRGGENTLYFSDFISEYCGMVENIGDFARLVADSQRIISNKPLG